MGKTIAVTGLIGSGKSTVCDILRKKNNFVISADDVYHKLLDERGECYNELLRYFGDDILAADGNIDRKILSAIVFSDEKKLGKLNDITHKHVLAEIELIAKNSDCKIVFVEIPPTDGDYTSFFDEVLVVRSDEKALAERVKKRDKRTFDECKEIIANQQKSPLFKVSGSIIYNNSDITSLEKEVDKFLAGIGNII